MTHKANVLTEESAIFLRTIMARGTTAEELARKLHTNRRTLFNILAGKQVSKTLRPHVTAFIEAAQPSIPIFVHSQDNFQKTLLERISHSNLFLSKYFLDAELKRNGELRNLIVDQTIRDRLRELKNPPELSTAIEATGLFHANDRGLKDKTGNNHFLSISAFIEFIWENQPEPVLVTYSRNCPFFGGYTEHTGNALLWNASFIYNRLPSGEFSSTPINNWMNTVIQNPEKAEQQFLEGPHSILFQVLHHKIAIFRPAIVKPFGVLTLQLKPTRLNSYYIFKISIDLGARRNIEKEISTFSTTMIPMKTEIAGNITEGFFQSPTPDPIGDRMHTITLNALLKPSESRVDEENVKFTSGFHLIPPIAVPQ